MPYVRVNCTIVSTRQMVTMPGHIATSYAKLKAIY